MEVFAVIISIVGAFALLGQAAMSWGTDSRETLPDDHRR